MKISLPRNKKKKKQSPITAQTGGLPLSKHPRSSFHLRAPRGTVTALWLRILVQIEIQPPHSHHRLPLLILTVAVLLAVIFNGAIALLEVLPHERRPPPEPLRLRHPQAAPADGRGGAARGLHPLQDLVELLHLGVAHRLRPVIGALLRSLVAAGSPCPPTVSAVGGLVGGRSLSLGRVH